MLKPKKTAIADNPLELIPPDGPFLAYIPGWTEERYFAEAPESLFTEFEDGELIVPSPVSLRHQAITGFLWTLLGLYVEANNLGEVYAGPAVVRLRPGLALEPDLFFVSTEQLPRLEIQYFSGAPKLVVEVLSPGNRRRDLRDKVAHYQHHGVLEYWIVDPEGRRLLQHLLPSQPATSYIVSEFNAGPLESRAVPGFRVEVSWLWEEPLPGKLECFRRIMLIVEP